MGSTLTYTQRGIFAAVCVFFGFFFWPLLVLGGLIAWSVYDDIKKAPALQKQADEVKARINAPVSVEDIRLRCESPAEIAFLETLVSEYFLRPGPGGIEGRGLRLRSQVWMGKLRIHSGFASSEYRADFLIDEKLVVEIDGAAYHSSPDEIARDLQRDADIKREGFAVLRLPAQTVFTSPADTLRRVEDARRSIRLLQNSGDVR